MPGVRDGAGEGFDLTGWVSSMSTNPPTNSAPLIVRVKLLGRPPGIHFHAAVALAAIVTVFFGVVASPWSSGAAFMLACVLMAGWLWIGGRWFFSLFRAWRSKSFSKWRWVSGPLVVIAVLCAGRDFDLRFALSRPAMEAYVARALAAPEGTPLPAPGEIGFFNFGRDAERLPHGVRLFTYMGANPFDEQGLAWSTTPLPEYPAEPIGAQKHYLGNWYKWWGF